jgi:UDP-glucose 4-epimerase
MEVVRSSSSDKSGIDPDSGVLPASFSLPSSASAVVYLAQSPFSASMPKMAPHLLTVNALTPVQAAIAARAAGVTRFIYASTGSVYQPRFGALRESDPLRRDSWYPLSKVHGEEALACLQSEMDITCVRIFGLYGQQQTGRLVPKLIEAVIRRLPVSLERPGADSEPDGGLRISLLHVRDATRILQALLHKHELPALNLASDEALSIRELCEIIGEHLGLAPVFREAPRPRQGDMVADISLLTRVLEPAFTNFRSEVAELVEIAPSST